jgi:hypothetical protein
MMKKEIILLIFVGVFLGCKSKAGMAELGAMSELSTKKIIDKHYDSSKNFTTAYIRAITNYKDDKQSLSLTSEIKIKKDEIILISIRFLGITMAKGIITPTEVKYYEKSGNSYFEGDYTTLSNWLGTDLNFEKVQNMLIGQAMDDLRVGKFKNTIEDKLYKLEEISNETTQKSFYFEASNFLIKKQDINQAMQERKLSVSYPEYKEFKEGALPLKVFIEAFHKNDNTRISLEYRNITFNEDLSFPYSVPSGYERIYITK